MLVELLLGTGIRIGSAIALDIGDIDFAHGEITMRTTKNNRPSTAVQPAAVAEKLKGFLAARTQGPVFQAGDRRISTRHAQRRLSGWLAKAGITGRSARAAMRKAIAVLQAAAGQ